MLTNYDGKYIVYDAIGNPLADGTWSYTWEQGRKLTRMQGSAGTWNYTYNSDGMRISRTSLTDSYSYWYDGDGRLLRMKYNDIVMSFSYSASGQPISITYDGMVYYYLLNAQGDVVGLIDSTGALVVQYTYDAWGRLLSITYPTDDTTSSLYSALGVNNPLRYRGYVYDTETELYYLQSRYYNPSWGRFINADDPGYMGVDGTPSSYNLFAYCGNNPISNYDPTGCFLLSTAVLIGAMIGGAIGATAGGVIAYNIAKDSGAEGWELIGWTALGILGGGAVGAAAGAAIGYGVGYLAGGTYASGLPAKSVGNAVKSFVSQENKVHHVLSKAGHKLSGYTTKSMGKLMKRTLADGVVGSYKSVQSAVLAPIGSEVTFTIIGGAIKVSDMWIQ